MSMSNVKVSTRLSLGFGAILLIMLALTAIGIWRMQVISDVMVTMTKQDNVRLQETMRWRENTQKNWIRTRAMLLNASPQFNAIWEPEIAATSAAISEGQKKIESLLRFEEGIRLFKGLDSHRAAYRNLRTALMQQSANGDHVADRVEPELKPLADAYDQALGQFADYQLKGLYRNARNRLGPSAPKPNHAGQRRRHHLAAGHLGSLGTGALHHPAPAPGRGHCR